MPRKGENIYKRKDGRWEGRYICGKKPDGKKKYGSVYGKTYMEVKQKLIQIKAVTKIDFNSWCYVKITGVRGKRCVSNI